MGINRVSEMKIFALIGSALAFGPQFPNEMRTQDDFWMKAVAHSHPSGFSGINNIKCERNIHIEGTGRGEEHTKECVINFQAIDTSTGYSDVLNCYTEVAVTACKYCRRAPVFDTKAAQCSPEGQQHPEAVPYGRGK